MFEADVAGHAAEATLARLAEEQGIAAPGLAVELVRGVLAYRAALDAAIQETAPAWPLAQLATADRNLLRLAVYEILFGDASVAIAISEAIELARSFGSDSSPRFVNGVLGSIAANRAAILENLSKERG